MLPLPYGLLANELIEVIDNERILPGLVQINKIEEDFPNVDNHNMNLAK